MKLACRDSFFFRLRLIVLALSSVPLPVSAQLAPKSVTARFITDEITVDGRMDEAIWSAAETGSDFQQFFPTDSSLARYATRFKVLYSDTTLYIGIQADTAGDRYAVSTLERDFSAITNDNVSLLFDTFSNGNTAYLFGVTPYGVQREALMSDGGSALNAAWDVKWRAEATRSDELYQIEMAIPLSSLKFPEGSTRWNFRSYRWDIQSNEQSSWLRVPQNQRLSSLAYMGDLNFERPLEKSRTPFSFIPYAAGRVQRGGSASGSDSELDFGADAKVAIGAGMNLDITVNPDFSNVEVDEIFTNLTRFEVELPEKRQFFIDNSDLFESFGNTLDEARPFFSRRIGLARDPDGNLIENDINAGMRLSGNMNEDWRLGVLGIQTARDEANEIASYNNAMLALQRKVGGRSNVGVFWVGREVAGSEDFVAESDEYNSVVGADYNLASDDGVWTGKFYLHKSFQPGDSSGNLSSQAVLTWNPRDWMIIGEVTHVDEDFRADLGFVPRTDILKPGVGINRYFYPEGGSVSSHRIGFVSISYLAPSLDYKRTDQNLRLRWEASFRNQATSDMVLTNKYVYLTEPFDPTRTPGAVPLPADQAYRYNQMLISYTSNNTNRFTYSVETEFGGFFNGDIFSLAGEVAYRVQPWAQFGLAVEYDGIRLPDPHEDADIWLVTPRVDITFSKNLFWSTLIQYNSRNDDFGINSRLQWRFAPLSDLYLVYNENQIGDDPSLDSRSVNLKVTYWWDI